MQIGERWRVGAEQPRSLAKYPEFAAVCSAEERALRDGAEGAPAPSWTLTWLEGRPVADLDGVIQVVQRADGQVHVLREGRDAQAPTVPTTAGGDGVDAEEDDDDEDLFPSR